MREFLNVLDGICEFDGSIILVTTNNPNALDPALIRPGRIDQRFDIGAYTAAEQIEHINRFFDTNLDLNDYPNMQLRTVAELQFMCTDNMSDVDQVIKQL
jgi:SpoVK/Ycf46/Vps4 family AAA+-type ATPase